MRMLKAFASTRTRRSAPGCAPRMPATPRPKNVAFPDGASSNSSSTSCESEVAGVQARLAAGEPLSSLAARNGAVRNAATNPGELVAAKDVAGDVPSGVDATAARKTESSRSSSVTGESRAEPALAAPDVADPSAPSRYVTGADFAGGHSPAVWRYQAPGG